MRPLLFLSLILLIFSACDNNTQSSASDAGADGGDTIDVVEDSATPDAADGDGGVVVSEPRLVEGLMVAHISVFQSVEIPIYDGVTQITTERNAPVIAHKPTTFIIHVEPDETWVSREITATLEITNDGATPQHFSATQVVTGPMDTNFPTAGFAIELPAESVTLTSTYKLRFTDDTSAPVAEGAPHAGRFPQDDSYLPLGAEGDGGGITLLLVPVIYNIDGSGRLPDTSATQLSFISSLLARVYPAATINLSVRDPIEWPQPGYESSSFDFGDMNTFLRELKSDDGAGQEVYYFALVRPEETFEEYCSGTCTTGQSFKVTNPDSGSYRVGTGVGFSGERWAWTVLHELGHMHGRGHARCGTWSGIDWSYPYSNGLIGVWGYDESAASFLDPDTTVDFMSYCDERWVSDYHYRLIHDRIIDVNGLNKKALPKAAFLSLLLNADGTTTWRGRSHHPPVGEIPVLYTFYDASGLPVDDRDGWGIAQSHEGATLLAIPEPPMGSRSVAITFTSSLAPLSIELP